MSSLQVARDTFIVYLEENLKDPTTGALLPVRVYDTPQQKAVMNALNVKFLSDLSIIENKVWEIMVSLDILVGRTDEKVSNELLSQGRLAVEKWQEAVRKVLEPGRTNGLYIRTPGGLSQRGTWVNTGHIEWRALEGLRFVDVPQETFIQKNITLPIIAYM